MRVKRLLLEREREERANERRTEGGSACQQRETGCRLGSCTCSFRLLLPSSLPLPLPLLSTSASFGRMPPPSPPEAREEEEEDALASVSEEDEEEKEEEGAKTATPQRRRSRLARALSSSSEAEEEETTQEKEQEAEEDSQEAAQEEEEGEEEEGVAGEEEGEENEEEEEEEEEVAETSRRKGKKRKRDKRPSRIDSSSDGDDGGSDTRGSQADRPTDKASLLQFLSTCKPSPTGYVCPFDPTHVIQRKDHFLRHLRGQGSRLAKCGPLSQSSSDSNATPQPLALARTSRRATKAVVPSSSLKKKKKKKKKEKQFILSSSRDTPTVCAKDQAWGRIHASFSSRSEALVSRSLKDLKKKYDNLVTKAKKEIAAHRGVGERSKQIGLQGVPRVPKQPPLDLPPFKATEKFTVHPDSRIMHASLPPSNQIREVKLMIYDRLDVDCNLPMTIAKEFSVRNPRSKEVDLRAVDAPHHLGEPSCLGEALLHHRVHPPSDPLASLFVGEVDEAGE